MKDDQMSDDDLMAEIYGGETPSDAAEFEQMDIGEFCDMIQQASIVARDNWSGQEFRQDRERQLDYYNGFVNDLPLIEGRSSMVSNDLRPIVAKVMPGVMRTFFSSPRVVEFNSDAIDDEQLVENVQTHINDDFMRNGGYIAAESSIYDALIHDEGVITYDIEEGSGKISFNAIPPENLIITPNARLEDDATLIGSWSRVTRSEMIKRGYDAKAIADVRDTSAIMSIEDLSRGIDDRDVELGDQSEEIDCYELYARVDFDGDGIAELRRLVFVGECTPETLLYNEPVSRRRIFIVRAENRPHSVRGRALSRDVMDIMRCKTALLRAAIDNIAKVNDPTTFIDINSVTNPDDLLARKNGAIVLVESFPAGGVAQTFQVPFTAQNCFEAMKYYDAALIDRTGISGAASGMLPDVLQGQTATAVNMIQTGGTARIELICRNIAECTLRPMFESIFLDLVEMSGLEVELKDTSINVGLGAGTRERDAQALGQVMMVQEKLLAAYGPPGDNPFVSFKTISATLSKLVEVSGLRTPETYFETPDDAKIQQIEQSKANQPNPDKIKADMQMALEEKKMQTQSMKEQSQAQADIAVKQAEAEKIELQERLDREQDQLNRAEKIMIEQMKIDSSEKIAQMKLDHEILMKKIESGNDPADIDPETGMKPPSESQMMMMAIAQLAEQIAGMQSASLAPRVMTTPDGRVYTSNVATVN